MDNSFSLKSFDFFGVPIPISYKNDYSYKTNVGAALSIISFLIILIYTLFEISTLLDRSSFTVITSESQDLEGKINLSYTPIMFQLLDLSWNSVEYDPKLFTFSATYTEVDFQSIDGVKKRIINIKNLEIERCDKLKKEFEALNEFSEYNLTKYMCIKPNQSLILYGSTSDVNKEVSSLSIQLSKCNNKSTECYNVDKINNLINNRIFAFIYLGYTTNFTNIYKDKNIEYKIYTNFINLSKYLRKKIIYNFNICKLNLFDSFFVTHKTVINYFSQKDHIRDFAFIEDISRYSDELIRFTIIYDSRLVEHTKSIKGIGQTLSYIMAVFNIVIIISRIVNDYYGNKILLSNLFQFLKNKNTNLYNFDKYKSCKDSNISKNELISKTPANSNYKLFGKNKFNFNSKKSSNQNNNPRLSIYKENQKAINIRYTKKDYWKFFICPYCLIKKNQFLYDIKDEICTIFSFENILEAIKSLASLHSLKTEFNNRVIENKMIINNCSKNKVFNDTESKSKIEMAKFSEAMNDK